MQNSAKGMIKSDNPDLLVNIFTKERERIDVQCWLGLWMGYGWNPYLWGGSYVSSTTEGTLYIDLMLKKN
jgi:hypothetical protein